MKAIWLLSLLTAIGVANAGADPVGCYSVVIGETSPPSSERVEARHLLRGKDIRLTSEPATTPWTRGQFFQVLPLASGDAFNYAASYWELKNGAFP